MKKKALITGITGQDGSYLAEFLLNKGYIVYGVQRRASWPNTNRIDHLYDNESKHPDFYMMYGDLADSSNLFRIINKIRPDEIYNLGAQSHVGISFDKPEYTTNINALGALRILETIRNLDFPVKYYQASSSEMFGKVLETPQSEKTPFNPQSPYGISKVFAFNMTKVYRTGYGLFASNGILFNHESPRRGLNFVTRKITLGLARVKLGLQDVLRLGNIEAKRDWGYSKDYVEAIWKILQHDVPDDFLISTGETHTVREFVNEVAKNLEIDLVWKGKGLKEKGVDKKTGKVIVEIDSNYFRPNEVDLLLGDSSKARKILGWKPRVTFKKLAQIMTDKDLEQAKIEKKIGSIVVNQKKFQIN
ncbi:MAG: GDP-mannose 4,6-dehydratase [Candidatus Taylorbacteria bacterium RIFCSPHIGHO2_02_FULL_45_28]|uniref:GDP-mannose 4,6-dehydratase n=1 Tax=Candidatus Taylorbacteria bacterium RIFCSPHIGHO2_12_FULL_45_16 TaxID=1802315 RepID=A0A1G2N0D7_9BACT|nr:MAG: GDP-mannose 4,6-dehydratase [Candidatus Taylorbacteria bacterium RIFCSPHIGHO2_01_FULL_44_110]OHA25240.1 MAG: GDP-mannose 4,6-dehydratase [Candidatus Taylorbacteria bacterium RIFCSPHIGHO2_02_FULL_45_28]OHA29483.1 MAG: GDP-mannose 4,6-dehydratase [Candidatus Taylorbacteria bacterium RIFCSPHIGHO2_12_FULL_45_16]OHA33245.1 MAG: GDP-mannose 4,6-dehydratase [Candidatus Taylorbacteria bacterium RIFCSPLOWO2_01_FULL_45_59]OHA38294.1 MAG: GDP-mannose 4,6-dehydratase [Candidatus Taylorbacteria bact